MKKTKNTSQTRNTLLNKCGTNHIMHPCPVLINQQHMHTKSNFLLVTNRLYLIEKFTFKTRSTVIMKTEINCETITIATPLQWNLSIADMLYSGHLSIADTFPENGWINGQSLIEKPPYSGQK